MKRLLKVLLWLCGSALVLAVCSVAALVVVDRYALQSAIRHAREIPSGRLAHVVLDSRRILLGDPHPDGKLALIPVEFRDLGPKYVAVYRERVDLVFYKSYDDEVTLEIRLHTPGGVYLVYPDGRTWRTEQLWKEKPNNELEPTISAVTDLGAQEVPPARVVAYL